MKVWQKYQPKLRKWPHILLTWVLYSESDIQVSDFNGSPNIIFTIKLLWNIYEENNIFFFDLSSSEEKTNLNSTSVHKITILINKIKGWNLYYGVLFANRKDNFIVGHLAEINSRFWSQHSQKSLNDLPKSFKIW